MCILQCLSCINFLSLILYLLYLSLTMFSYICRLPYATLDRHGVTKYTDINMRWKQTLWLKYGFLSPLINPNQMAFTCHMEAISRLSISPNKHHFLSHSYFDNLSTAYTYLSSQNKQRLPPLPIHLFRSAGICLSAAVISRQLTSAQPTSLYTDSLPAQRNHHSSPAPAPLPAPTASHERIF